MMQGLARYPFYWFLLVIALPLWGTGWFVKQKLNQVTLTLEATQMQAALLVDLRQSPSHQALVSKIKVEQSRFGVLLFNGEGKILFSSDEKAVESLESWQVQFESSRFFVQDAPLAAAGASLEQFKGDKEYLVYYALESKPIPVATDFFKLFALMAALGASAAGLAGWYYYYRIQRPVNLVLAKNQWLKETKDVVGAMIDIGLVKNHDLQEIVASRNQMLRQFFLEHSKHEIIFNSLHDGLFVFGADQRLIQVNFSAAMLLGRSEQELIGLKPSEIAFDPNQEWVGLWWNNYGFLSNFPNFEASLRAKNGAEIPVLGSGEMLISPTGQFGGMLLVCRDLSQAKALQQKVDVLSKVTEQSPVGVMVLSLEGQIEYINPSLERITGLSLTDQKGELPMFFQEQSMEETQRQEILQAFRERKAWDGEIFRDRKNGESYWERFMLSPIKDQGQNVVGFTVIREEITETKKLEELLTRNNKELEELVEERVADLQETSERLRIANRDLESLDRLKDDFLATVSHEFRTPLSAIIGFAENMLDLPMERAMEEKFLKVIITEGERLGLLINEILDTSALVAGKMEMKFEPVELHTLIQGACDTLKGLAQSRQITLESEPIEATLIGDKNRLLQLLINLVGNAIKFAPENSIVRIYGELTQQNCFLKVRDQGVGIPEDALEQIFDRFQQIENPLSHKKGTGIGLALAQMIVEAHQGRIWAENRSPGALFICEFPRTMKELG